MKRVLTVNPGLTAREIVRALATNGVRDLKTNVNEILYRSDFFERDGDLPPRWYPAGSGPNRPGPHVRATGPAHRIARRRRGANSLMRRRLGADTDRMDEGAYLETATRYLIAPTGTR